MSSETLFLSIDIVQSIHQRMILDFGGSAGVRDTGLLEAAVAMPKQRFGGALLHTDIAEQAAAYLYHLCSNHAFIDGNKRTALASAEFFLLLNEWRLNAANDELFNLTMGAAKGTVDKRTLTEFFQQHVGV